MEQWQELLFQLLFFGAVMAIGVFLGTLVIYCLCPQLREDIIKDIFGG